MQADDRRLFEHHRSEGPDYPLLRTNGTFSLTLSGRKANQRRYWKSERERLSFIKHAPELGLTIEDIRELTDLSQHPEKPCAEADRIATEQLTTVPEKIARLKKLEAELEKMSTHCHTNQVRDCYVI